MKENAQQFVLLKSGETSQAPNRPTAFALEQPAFGQVRVSSELCKQGAFVSASGVRVWLCHNLESFGKRLAALEKHVAQTGEVLTESQVSALEKKHEGDVAHKARSKRLILAIWEAGYSM